MEDANISVQKVTVSIDINISLPPLEIPDVFFLIPYVPSDQLYLVKIK